MTAVLINREEEKQAREGRMSCNHWGVDHNPEATSHGMLRITGEP